MLIKTKLSEKDYINGNFILLYSKISIKIFTTLILIFLVLTIVLAVLSYSPYSQIFVPLAMLIVMPFMTYFSAKRNFDANKMTGETIEYQFDNNYFSIKGESFSGSLPWERVYKVTQTKNWILVWQNMRNANPIPKRDISEVQLAEIKQILASHHVKNNL
jgi:hypothetical protein